MIGGLLFRYWDSGRRVTPVPPDDGFPGGLENTARNVRVKWLTKQSEGLPVPLRVLAERATARAEAHDPLARATRLWAMPATAAGEPAARQPLARARILLAQGGTAHGAGRVAQPTACMPPDLHVIAHAACRRMSQKERNRAAVEAATRLLLAQGGTAHAVGWRMSQKDRNRAAAEAAIRWLFEE